MYPAFLRGKHALIQQGICFAKLMLEDGVNKFRRFIDQRLEDPTNNDNDIDDAGPVEALRPLRPQP